MNRLETNGTRLALLLERLRHTLCAIRLHDDLSSSLTCCIYSVSDLLFFVRPYVPSDAEPSGYCRNSFLSQEAVLNGALADHLPVGE